MDVVITVGGIASMLAGLAVLISAEREFAKTKLPTIEKNFAFAALLVLGLTAILYELAIRYQL